MKRCVEHNLYRQTWKITGKSSSKEAFVEKQKKWNVNSRADCF